MSLIEAALQPWSAFEPPSRTGYRRECGRVNPLVFVSPDQRLGRGLGYGEDLVFLDAALERFGLALDAIRAQPRIIRGLHSQHFIRADWFKRWRSALSNSTNCPTANFCPAIVFAFRKTRSEKWLGPIPAHPSGGRLFIARCRSDVPHGYSGQVFVKPLEAFPPKVCPTAYR